MKTGLHYTASVIIFLTKTKYFSILNHCSGNSRNNLDLSFLQVFNGQDGTYLSGR